MENLFGIPGLTVAGVSTTAGLITLWGYILWYWVQRRKLSIEDRTALESGFTATTQHLMQENRRLREDLAGLELRHDQYRTQCEKENEDLRKQLEQRRAQEEQNRADILGLRRQLSQIAIACLSYVPSDVLKEHPFLGKMLDEILRYERPEGNA